MATYYIGADVHVNNTELTVKYKRKIVQRYSVPTNIPAIIAVLDSLQGRKFLAMEEGPMAGGLYRNLSRDVEKFIVCEPRRNKLTTAEGDKDDKIDAAKLAALLRDNFLKVVHHTNEAHLKHWTKFYHDRVRSVVRDINKIRACCRMHDVSPERSFVTKFIANMWLKYRLVIGCSLTLKYYVSFTLIVKSAFSRFADNNRPLELNYSSNGVSVIIG